ncbi:hypothetical protein [uncultured Fibrobacter sp.]|uniref:hypothetical protein n=1 Tax=uncultured Fibrobacter sp. TaxID=261512 RepID=UPI00262A25C6|nr:hypothetical protein [uncultured Fibrobacter sp.]
MKNKVFIALAAAVAMSALTACGDSSGSSEPSKAEACAQGISEDCLAGTWSLIGLANKNTGDIYPYADYKQAGKQPGKLIFDKEKKKFEMDLPVGVSTVDPNDYPIYGDWSIAEGGKLHLHMMTTAIEGFNFDLTPVIKVEGNIVRMTFDRLFFLAPEIDDSPANVNTEVYTISAE